MKYPDQNIHSSKSLIRYTKMSTRHRFYLSKMRKAEQAFKQRRDEVAKDDDVVNTGEPPAKEELLTSTQLVAKGISRNKMDWSKYRTQEDIKASVRTLDPNHSRHRSKQSSDKDESFRSPQRLQMMIAENSD